MSLLNLQDYSDFSNSRPYGFEVNDIINNVTYYYAMHFEDDYYYSVSYEKIYNTTSTQIIGIRDTIGEDSNGTPFINKYKEVKVTDLNLIQQITDDFNKQIDNYKKAHAKKESDNKGEAQKAYDSGLKKAYNEKTSYGYDYDTDVTTFTFKHGELVYPVFANANVKKLLVYRYPGYDEFYPKEDSPNLSSQDVWNVLSDRISKLKEKTDENMKSLKEKELKKTGADVKPNEISKENIENIPNKNLQSEIKKSNDDNKKVVEDSKPKFVIKIAKPLAKGYFIIDLGAMLKGLLGMLSAFAMGLLMSKLSSILAGLLSSMLNSKNTINTSAVNSAVNSINVPGLIQETLDDENVLKLNTIISQNKTNDFNTTSMLDSTGTYGNDVVDVKLDVTTDSNNINKFIKKNNEKEFYSMNKRGRLDLLNSLAANNRLNNNQTNKKLTYNPNYGKYR